jgi:hypothetical protein
MLLEFKILPKFVRMYERCMHRVHSCIYIFALLLPLYLLVLLCISYSVYKLSHKNYNLLLQMATLDAPIVSDTFLNAFGTPTLLWRVLHSVSYMEPPRCNWKEVET